MWRLPNNHNTCRIPSSKIHLGFGNQIRNGHAHGKIVQQKSKLSLLKHEITFVNKNIGVLFLCRSFAAPRALPPPSKNGPSKRMNFKLPNFKWPNFKMPDFKNYFNEDSMLWKLKGVLLGITATGLTVYYAGGVVFFLSKFLVVGAVGMLAAVGFINILTRHWAARLLRNSYHLLSLNKARIEKEIGSPFEIPTEVEDFEFKRKTSPRISPLYGRLDSILQMSYVLRGEESFGNLIIQGSKEKSWQPIEISLELFTPEGKKKIPLYDNHLTYDILELKPRGKAVFVQRAKQEDKEPEPDILQKILDSRPIKSANELIKQEIQRSERLLKRREEGFEILLSMDEEVEEVLEELPPNVKEYYQQQEEQEKLKKLGEEIQKRKPTTRKLY